MRALLEAGAPANARTRDGSTPLHYAISSAASGGAHEYDLNYTPDEYASDSFIDYMRDEREAALEKIDAMVDKLLEYGADPRAADTSGRTALTIARDIEGLKGSEVYWRLNDLGFD